METTDPCRRCGRLAPVQPWRQRFPDSGSVRLCAACSDRLAADADAFSTSLVDGGRLLAVARALAGEVWDCGDRSYWFRVPPLRPSPRGTVLRGRLPAAQAHTVTLRQVAKGGGARPVPVAALGKPVAAARAGRPARRNI